MQALYFCVYIGAQELAAQGEKTNNCAIKAKEEETFAIEWEYHHHDHKLKWGEFSSRDFSLLFLLLREKHNNATAGLTDQA